MKKTIKALTLLTVLSVSATANAALDIEGNITVFHTNVDTNIDSISVQLDSNEANPESCPFSGWYRITSANTGYKTAVSVMLSAYALQKKVRLHLKGCEEYPRIAKVTIL